MKWNEWVREREKEVGRDPFFFLSFPRGKKRRRRKIVPVRELLS